MNTAQPLIKECKNNQLCLGSFDICPESSRASKYGEIVRITLPNGERATGQVLDISKDIAVTQVYEGTSGIDAMETRVRFTGEPPKVDVSIDMLGTDI